MRTFSDMQTAALPATGHLLHFELAAAYEIVGTRHAEPPGAAATRCCRLGPTQVGPFVVEPDQGLERLIIADTVIVPACTNQAGFRAAKRAPAAVS